jgi:hypothetical protein
VVVVKEILAALVEWVPDRNNTKRKIITTTTSSNSNALMEKADSSSAMKKLDLQPTKCQVLIYQM